MEALATQRMARISPRKVRIILNAIRHDNVHEALTRLRFTNKRAARVVYKVLASAVANAQVKFGKADTQDLYISRAIANEGPTMRRFMPRARGRASRINKRTSHITIAVTEVE